METDINRYPTRQGAEDQGLRLTSLWRCSRDRGALRSLLYPNIYLIKTVVSVYRTLYCPFGALTVSVRRQDRENSTEKASEADQGIAIESADERVRRCESPRWRCCGSGGKCCLCS